MFVLHVFSCYVFNKANTNRPPAKNSAATSVPQQAPTATLIPVNISGSEFEKITCLNICHLEAPKECTACIFDNCVPEAPALADTIIIAKETINNKNIFPELSIKGCEKFKFIICV